jgi:hypothetical protein
MFTNLKERRHLARVSMSALADFSLSSDAFPVTRRWWESMLCLLGRGSLIKSDACPLYFFQVLLCPHPDSAKGSA